jgi:hypothetical protein
MGRSAIHPGEHLAEQLEALSMSAAELARHLRVPTNRINLQKIYELRLAEAKSWETIKGLPTLGKASKKRGGDIRPEPR